MDEKIENEPVQGELPFGGNGQDQAVESVEVSSKENASSEQPCCGPRQGCTSPKCTGTDGPGFAGEQGDTSEKPEEEPSPAPPPSTPTDTDADTTPEEHLTVPEEVSPYSEMAAPSWSDDGKFYLTKGAQKAWQSAVDEGIIPHIPSSDREEIEFLSGFWESPPDVGEVFARRPGDYKAPKKVGESTTPKWTPEQQALLLSVKRRRTEIAATDTYVVLRKATGDNLFEYAECLKQDEENIKFYAELLKDVPGVEASIRQTGPILIYVKGPRIYLEHLTEENYSCLQKESEIPQGTPAGWRRDENGVWFYPIPKREWF